MITNSSACRWCHFEPPKGGCFGASCAMLLTYSSPSFCVKPLLIVDTRKKGARRNGPPDVPGSLDSRSRKKLNKYTRPSRRGILIFNPIGWRASSRANPRIDALRMGGTGVKAICVTYYPQHPAYFFHVCSLRTLKLAKGVPIC